MITRKRTASQAYPGSWLVATTTVLNGRTVTPGQELSITGERGRFRFEKHVMNTDNGAEWITVLGGPAGVTAWRDFRPDRVRTVHNRRGNNP